jgi:hypothetical protein
MNAPPADRRNHGFTLIELTLAVATGMAVAALLMALVNQQFAFLRIYGVQNFILDEAPIVSNHVSRIVAGADRFRVHASVADALAGRNPTTEPSPVLRLEFGQPDGSRRSTILYFGTVNGVRGLYHYVVPVVGVLADPEWAITRKARDVSFAIEEGILRMTLTGQAGEKITYSGTMQR